MTAGAVDVEVTTVSREFIGRTRDILPIRSAAAV